MSQVNCTCSCKPRIFNRSFFTSSKERWKCENTYWNSSECSSPPCSVPREYRLANDFTNETSWDGELRKVFAPAQVTIREQYIPIRENEPCLSIRVSSTVEWRRNEPGVKQEYCCHKRKQNCISKYLMRPESMPCAGTLSFTFYL